MSLKGEMLLCGCLSLLMWEVECPSMKPTAGSACAGTVEGSTGIFARQLKTQTNLDNFSCFVFYL